MLNEISALEDHSIPGYFLHLWLTVKGRKEGNTCPSNPKGNIPAEGPCDSLGPTPAPAAQKPETWGPRGCG